MNILTGAFARDSAIDMVMQLQVGANMDQNKQIFIGTMTASALKIADTSISTVESANRAIGLVDMALKTVSKQRADLGAYQNRFEMAAKGVAIAAENMQASESRIRDVDMAAEMVDFVKNQILTQSNMAMLAQANMKTQSVIQLLG